MWRIRGVIANYRSISHREALTFRTMKGEFGLLGVDYRGTPERLGRLLHGIYEACGGGMGESGGFAATEGTCGNVSHTPTRKCSPPS